MASSDTTEVESIPDYVKELEAVISESDLHMAYIKNLEILVRTKGVTSPEVKEHSFYMGYMGRVRDFQSTQKSEKMESLVALSVFRDYLADLAALECLEELVEGILNNWQTVSREAVLTCHRDLVFRIRTIELGEISGIIIHRLLCEDPCYVTSSYDSKTGQQKDSVDTGFLPKVRDKPDIWRIFDIWKKIAWLSQNASQQALEDLLEIVKRIVEQFQDRNLLPIQRNFNMTYFLFRIEKALANFFQKRFNEAIPNQQYEIGREDSDIDTTYNIAYQGIDKLAMNVVMSEGDLPPRWISQVKADARGQLSAQDREKLLHSYRYIPQYTSRIWDMKEKFNERKNDIVRERYRMFFPQNTPAILEKLEEAKVEVDVSATVDAALPSSSGAVALPADRPSSSALTPATVDAALPSSSGAAALPSDRPSSSALTPATVDAALPSSLGA